MKSLASNRIDLDAGPMFGEKLFATIKARYAKVARRVLFFRAVRTKE
jgi:hypothetical protein